MEIKHFFGISTSYQFVQWKISGKPKAFLQIRAGASHLSGDKQIETFAQDGPLLVINGVKISINGLK